MRVNVTTFHAKNCKEESTKVIDWQNSSDRKWLMNHLHWAMNNDHFVGLNPLSESN